MEYLVLNSYLEFRKNNSPKIGNTLKEMKMSHKVVIVLIIVLIVVAGVFNNMNRKEVETILLTIIFLLFLYISKSQSMLDIELSTEKLEQKDNDYMKIKIWLESIGFVEKNQIKQLCNRCEKIIEKKERQQENLEKRVDQVFAALFFPAWLALIAWFLGLDNGTVDIYVRVIVMVIFAVIIYVGSTCLIREINEIGNGTKNDMQRMINDLHGVLDRKFEIEESDLK